MSAEAADFAEFQAQHKVTHDTWQYQLRERFLLGLERTAEALAAGDSERAAKYVDVALDIENYETEYVIDLFTVEDEEPEPAFGIVP